MNPNTCRSSANVGTASWSHGFSRGRNRDSGAVTGRVAFTSRERAGSVAVRSRRNVADPWRSAPGRFTSACDSDWLSEESACIVTRA